MQGQSPKSIKVTETEIIKMRRRLKKLQEKNRNQKQLAERNSSLTNQILKKKIVLAQSLLESQRQREQNAQKQQRRLQQLKQINSYKRVKHKNQLNNIMKAVYLVKMDDANEIRRISDEHKSKVKALNNSTAQINQKRRDKIKSQGGRKQQKYWKQKLYKLYLQNHAERMNTELSKKQKLAELMMLEKQQEKLINRLDENQQISETSKKQYISAISLPIKQVAEAIKHQKTNDLQLDESDRVTMKNSMSQRIPRNKIKKQNGLLFNNKNTINPQRQNIFKEPQANYLSQFLQNQEETPFPKTQVNEAKLKIVLQKLRSKKKKQ